jgi:hypothetical protein
MIDLDDGTTPTRDDELALADLTEAISRRLESGEPINSGDLGGDPDRAGSIRQLLPALRSMVSLGEHVAREEDSRTRLQKNKKRTL